MGVHIILAPRTAEHRSYQNLLPRLFSGMLFHFFEASGSSTSQWCARNLLLAETKA